MKIYFLFLTIFTAMGADAVDSSCGVVPMIQWSGENSRRSEELPKPVNIVVIQHTVSSECNTDVECESVVKSIRAYHIGLLGFTDIGLSFLIGGNGKVYEGAGWSYVGAHTLKYNSKSIGVSFIGDFRQKLPTQQALQAAQDLIACGVENKYLGENYHLISHRQLSLTVSPGDALHSHIQSWPHRLEDIKQLTR